MRIEGESKPYFVHPGAWQIILQREVALVSFFIVDSKVTIGISYLWYGRAVGYLQNLSKNHSITLLDRNEGRNDWVCGPCSVMCTKEANMKHPLYQVYYKLCQFKALFGKKSTWIFFYVLPNSTGFDAIAPSLVDRLSNYGHFNCD